jgi:hypothetical protein
VTGRCRISAKNKDLRDVLSRFSRFSPCVWGLSVASCNFEIGRVEERARGVEDEKCGFKKVCWSLVTWRELPRWMDLRSGISLVF